MREKQSQFVWMIADLLTWIRGTLPGYELTFGEAFRTAHEAEWEAQQGLGVARSLHTIRLALDLNLFINGVYQTDSEAHRPLGEYWEKMGGSWGGRFAKPDANHYSLEHDGVR